MPDLHVAIVGGGASGSLLAAQLLRSSASVHVCIIEPADTLGLGVAYSTSCPAHLLNVPASRMSAFPDDPKDFVRWLVGRSDAYAPNAFVPRALYGAYLNETIETARRRAGDRFTHVQAKAVAIHEHAHGVTIDTAGGGEAVADVVAIAIGNAAPARWPGLDSVAAQGAAVFQSAWEAGALIPADPDEAVLLLGTGLTAVDAVLGLRHNGHRGTIHMISRRGLLPHEHRLFDMPPQVDPDAKTMEDVFDAVRTAVRDSETRVDWRVAMDSMRPRTNAMWQSMDLRAQRRFMRHALPYWNVHRHRMAPQIARTLSDLIAAGSLHMIAGRTGTIAATQGRLDVSIRERGTDDATTLCVDRLINCSGPQHDITKLPNALVSDMLAKGLLVPHELGIGAKVSENGALHRADGSPSEKIYAIGPVRLGTLIETTAIPEIRAQAADLAATLLQARVDA